MKNPEQETPSVHPITPLSGDSAFEREGTGSQVVQVPTATGYGSLSSRGPGGASSPVLARFPHRRSEQELDSLACLFLCVHDLGQHSQVHLAMESAAARPDCRKGKSKRSRGREKEAEATAAPGGPLRVAAHRQGPGLPRRAFCINLVLLS